MFKVFKPLAEYAKYQKAINLKAISKHRHMKKEYFHKITSINKVFRLVVSTAFKKGLFDGNQTANTLLENFISKISCKKSNKLNYFTKYSRSIDKNDILNLQALIDSNNIKKATTLTCNNINNKANCKDDISKNLTTSILKNSINASNCNIINNSLRGSICDNNNSINFNNDKNSNCLRSNNSLSISNNKSYDNSILEINNVLNISSTSNDNLFEVLSIYSYNKDEENIISSSLYSNRYLSLTNNDNKNDFHKNIQDLINYNFIRSINE